MERNGAPAACELAAGFRFARHAAITSRRVSDDAIRVAWQGALALTAEHASGHE